MFNSLSNDKMVNWSKFKPFVEPQLNVVEMPKFTFSRVEKIARKGENADYQDFLLLQQFCKNVTFSGLLKV